MSAGILTNTQVFYEIVGKRKKKNGKRKCAVVKIQAANLSAYCHQIIIDWPHSAGGINYNQAKQGIVPIETDKEPSINIRILGSSSAGNSTLIWAGKEALLVDFGFSQKYTLEKFEQAGVDFSALRGVLLTHLHSDHLSKSMFNKLIKERIPIHCHRAVYKPLLRQYRPKDQNLILPFSDQQLFKIASFQIQGFRVPHDSYGGCYGFNIFLGSQKISLATDLAFAGNGLAKNFIDSDILVLESNYDPDMLENSGRPFELIERIKTEGHLSNEQSAQLLDKILQQSQKKPQAVFLTHLSQQCNLAQLAAGGIRKVLHAHRLNKTQLLIAEKRKASNTVRI